MTFQLRAAQVVAQLGLVLLPSYHHLGTRKVQAVALVEGLSALSEANLVAYQQYGPETVASWLIASN